MTRLRTFSELSQLRTFDERFDYLSVRAGVGIATFGYERYLNQGFYTSREWRQARQAVIARDLGCNLGIPGQEIYDRVTIHHMNPITVDDVYSGNPDILDPEFLITVDQLTHNAIHYGSKSTLPTPMAERRPGDTNLW